MGDPVQFELRGYELTLRLDEARKIEVGTPYPVSYTHLNYGVQGFGEPA